MNDWETPYDHYDVNCSNFFFAFAQQYQNHCLQILKHIFNTSTKPIFSRSYYSAKVWVTFRTNSNKQKEMTATPIK